MNCPDCKGPLSVVKCLSSYCRWPWDVICKKCNRMFTGGYTEGEALHKRENLKDYYP